MVTIVDKKYIKSMDKFREPRTELGLIGACSENVVVFAEKMLGYRLYAWQVEFLNKVQGVGGNDRNFAVMTSRQIGKSFSVAVLSLWAAVFNKFPGTAYNNTNVAIISRGDRQAKELLREIKKLIHMGNSKMSEYKDKEGNQIFGDSFFTDLLDPNAPNNSTDITFLPWSKGMGDYVCKGSKYGSVIQSYPPTSVVLGKTFSLIIVDEAGHTTSISDEFFYEDLGPTGNACNAVRIVISTPWVPSGFFYRYMDPDGVFESMSINRFVFTIDAIKIENPQYYENVMRGMIKPLELDGKMDAVQRGYYCRFVQGEKIFFDPDKVYGVFDKHVEYKQSYDDKCDIGVDFGGESNSRTVLTVTAFNEEGVITRITDRVFGVGEDNDIIPVIKVMMTKYNIQRVIVDNCPAGQYLIREMEGIGWDVQRMSFASEKISKYTAFRSMINKGLVKSYVDDDLKTEMLALESRQGKRNLQISHAPGYSDDRIDSFVISSYFYLDDVKEAFVVSYDELYD